MNQFTKLQVVHDSFQFSREEDACPLSWSRLKETLADPLSANMHIRVQARRCHNLVGVIVEEYVLPSSAVSTL
jgi:hypothetical protein